MSPTDDVRHASPRSCTGAGPSDELALVEEMLTAQVGHHATKLTGVSDELQQVSDAVTEMVRGGKRLRAAFCLAGAHGSARGEVVPGAVEMAAAIELFHLAALVHDDLMDNSDLRRGQPTVHRRFADEHVRSRRRGSADGHGSAVAVLVGDMCLSWSDDLATAAADTLDIDGRRAVRSMWSAMRDEAYGGQFLDMLSQTEAATSRDRTHRVLRYKSARYTVSRPLGLGGALGGAHPELLARYDEIGLAAGEAFQLRDDVLGVFGDEHVTGKPAVDDIREGKRTLLIAVAEERAGFAQRRVLSRHLGNSVVTSADVESVREVLRDTGAVEAVEDRIDTLTGDALSMVDELDVDTHTRQCLAELIHRCVRRRS
ncbi:polyprenyl synthetase family protein [Gordonia soli]|uniref:Putative polyprenyl synthase n=1 Tax=Gordonia soli NBRC 108243 TaxID=1223545 RepID=M0QEU6_9ACTN|nr:polyprenyl synthetase family protein [Gordonia soli]GAC66964.1 putative polyprenyl synthase [Gordonia soli NBRC 108243]